MVMLYKHWANHSAQGRLFFLLFQLEVRCYDGNSYQKKIEELIEKVS